MRLAKNGLLLSLLTIQSSVYAVTGIIVGTDGSATYGAIVLPDGTMTILPHTGGSHSLPSYGELASVAINSYGYSLIGGFGANNAYGFLVSPSGTITNLPNAGGAGNLPAKGLIHSVAINDSRLGLVGGTDSSGSSAAAYGAHISSEGVVTNLPNAGGAGNLPAKGYLQSVAINDSGLGLVGGIDSNSGTDAAYGAHISSDGIVTNLPNAGGVGNLPSDGAIYSVGINSSGVGLVGGASGSAAYGAHISSNGTVTNLPNAGGDGNLPSGGFLNSVAINSSGAGLIGGVDTTGGPGGYAALVSPTGIVTNLSDVSLKATSINSVAINNANEGIIGGNAGTMSYAALVSADGALTVLPSEDGDGMPSYGAINNVAISNSGLSLIGGMKHNGPAYAALVSPSGTVTNLSSIKLSSNGEIYNVAISSDAVLSEATPQSVGSYCSAIYSQLAMSEALESHLTLRSQWSKGGAPAQNISLLAAIEEKPPSSSPQSKYTIWVEPFGNYIHLKKQGSIPQYTNTIGGALAAFDYHASNLLVGGGLGYAFNYGGNCKTNAQKMIFRALTNLALF